MTISYQLRSLTRRFPGVLAVDNVDLSVRNGEIHGIIGRNGAGKSVLVGMIAGLIAPSEGTVEIGDGRLDHRHSSPVLAHGLGVSLIPQEPKFARDLSVTDNLFMGRPLTRTANFVRPADMTRRVVEVIDRLDLGASPDQRMRDLPIETQQLLAFGKACFIDRARIILLDEITASLSRERKQMLLSLLRKLAASSPDLSFTLISHHISEVMEFTDRVTVMRDGKAVATLTTSDTDERTLADWIVGDAAIRPIAAGSPPTPTSGEPPLLEVDGLATEHYSGLSFSVRRGDVVGFAGLEGSGKDAAVESLFGLRPANTGSIRLLGETVDLDNPKVALDNGIAFLPKHRDAQAILQNRSVEDNILIASLGRFSLRFGFLDRRASREAAREKSRSLAVKTPSLDTPIDHLSGGNKQKVLIARLALTTPKLLLLNEPTRGVDIASKPELLSIVRNTLTEHAAVVMLSESEDELIAVCDRILIFFQGKVVRVLERGQSDFNVGEVYTSLQGVRAS